MAFSPVAGNLQRAWASQQIPALSAVSALGRRLATLHAPSSVRVSLRGVSSGPPESASVAGAGSGDPFVPGSSYSLPPETGAATPSNIAAAVFGVSALTRAQQAAIKAAAEGRDVFLSLPTGAGKSLCYQLPATARPGLTLVVSPLVALIQDQVSACLNAGLPATFLTSQTPRELRTRIWAELRRVDDTAFKLLYVTPEMVSSNPHFSSALARLDRHNLLQRFVVDEAHCISEWGFDFRPDFRRLAMLRSEVAPGVPFTCATSSGTPLVVRDIASVLGLRDIALIKTSFNRPNIRYEVWDKSDSVADDIYAFVSARFAGQTGLVYTLTTSDAETIARELGAMGLSTDYYHAGMPLDRRSRVQAEWMAGSTKVLCTTVAFGLGINKADVRFVAHHTLPMSLEAYYQQSGRAGRDGLPAVAAVFYRWKDSVRVRAVQDKNPAGPPRKGLLAANAGAPEGQDTEHAPEVPVRDSNASAAAAERVDDVVQYCQLTHQCRRQFLIRYLGERLARNVCRRAAGCDNCGP